MNRGKVQEQAPIEEEEEEEEEEPFSPPENATPSPRLPKRSRPTRHGESGLRKGFGLC